MTYQLWIEVEHPLCVAIGRFGVCRFPAGRYVYTGSARRNFEARIARHLRQEKKPHWHIDYLLAAPGVRIVDVRRFTVAECAVNQATPGLVTIPGFGATDCRAGCRAHLKYLEGHIETDSLARGDATGRTPSSVRRHRRK